MKDRTELVEEIIDLSEPPERPAMADLRRPARTVAGGPGSRRERVEPELYDSDGEIRPLDTDTRYQ